LILFKKIETKKVEKVGYKENFFGYKENFFGYKEI